MEPHVQNSSGWTPLIMGIVCEHSPSSIVSLPEPNDPSYPDFRCLRVPCAGRINPQYILRAFQKGADAVLVTGCPPGKCHYPGGNYYAQHRLQLITELLQFMGMEKERIQVKWTDSIEREGLRETVKRVAREVEKMGPNTLFKEEL
ncbi:Methyl-viologen-reducing hydrogenase, delta subunit [Acididesulfobacillus acetoxydans]|uniref:Methyl-viologen-reducing hydrogenase, delta subunit n=1 Tax=Acididesulfobacillus acetoxydans TaxID=1561005 RepID=A0A8S0WIH7_9FIRM|nr:hydrogenase iron-sulfur subunit [Acididesulfobacillus acetoxydans]CAA7603352.1 Methyl-viologen-reducing hydrogenase, delta subunit [Acididesulfobacillus acetoxydans]CEJ09319.1 Methyl-viologen-reducing hydrogenase, delta subunit [Acididesulfobacillus acetoxydans]